MAGNITLEDIDRALDVLDEILEKIRDFERVTAKFLEVNVDDLPENARQIYEKARKKLEDGIWVMKHGQTMSSTAVLDLTDVLKVPVVEE